MAKKIYLDNAASTPIDKKVVAEMAEAAKLYGNPSSYNDCGREAREYIEQARLKVARFLGSHPDEIIFTSSGTEANNLAIQGIARNFITRLWALQLITFDGASMILTNEPSMRAMHGMWNTLLPKWASKKLKACTIVVATT